VRSATELSGQLAAHLATLADKPALVCVSDPDSPAEGESLTYRQVHDAACRVGALLQTRLRVGDRAVLMYPVRAAVRPRR
jgi:acyl-CoA synthetase (AMP-forming)/AMP-acid ligase II